MGAIRDTKRDFYARLEHMAEENPHEIYVVEDVSAIRNQARADGVELSVGDPELLISDKQPAKRTQEGEDRFPHKYVKKYQAPSGNWVYIYPEDEQKQTGFKTPEDMPHPPAVGKKRTDMKAAVKNKPQAFQDYVKAGLQHPESTQQAIAEAVKMHGQAAFQRMVDRVKANHPHLTDPRDQAFLVEAVARNLIGRKVEEFTQQAHATPEGSKNKPNRFAKRPGGFMPANPAERQPWQLTKEEFEARKGLDPKVGGKDYHATVKDAIQRGEYVPAMVFAQDGMEDLRNLAQDNKPKMELSPETKAYVEKYERLAADLPERPGQWIKSEVRDEGNKYLFGQKASGYNIDSYDVADAGIYSHMMTAKEHIVMYHMYAAQKEHGRELLALMHENGLNPEYTVVKRVSAVKWDKSWPRERELEYKEHGDNLVGYSADYILAFRPRNQEEAEAINDLIQERANINPNNPNRHQGIHNSWMTPDVRASQKTDSFEQMYLNVKRMGSQELCILTRNDWIRSGKQAAPSSEEEARLSSKDDLGDYDEGFRREQTWVNPELAEYVKSVRVNFYKSQRFPGQFIYISHE